MQSFFTQKSFEAVKNCHFDDSRKYATAICFWIVCLASTPALIPETVEGVPPDTADFSHGPSTNSCTCTSC